MDDRVDVRIPVEPDIASALANPTRRAAAGRVLTDLINGNHARDFLAEALAAAQEEARGNGLTPEDVDAEVRRWCAEEACLDAEAEADHHSGRVVSHERVTEWLGKLVQGERAPRPRASHPTA